MTLTQILIFAVFSLLVGWLVPSRWRGWTLFVGSLIAIYWLQTSSPIRNLDFWLPTASIALTIFVWAVTQRAQPVDRRATLTGALVVAGVVLGVGLTRYTEPFCCLTTTRPPEIFRIILFLGLAGVASFVPYRLLPQKRFWSTAAIVLILGLFVVLKTEPLARGFSAGLRTTTGQSGELASAFDLAWLGFSFLAFRLLHVLRDHQLGRLPAYGLSEFVTYAIFFPTFTAGPIDRSQRFIGELQIVSGTGAETVQDQEGRSDVVVGGQRMLIGIFKKFVLADSLALFALNGHNATQVTSTLWMWVLLYAFALRIYFDFSGYTDIALGLGRLMGFHLPENFNRPYLKQNLTTFWNSWHMTLAQWFRVYYFNPLTRTLRTRMQELPVWVVILVGQVSTMLLIGLWHGVTWNFAIWGLWHGLGLFVHNRWSGWVRPRSGALQTRPRAQNLVQIGSWFVTFQYVVLGWVWFALPTVEAALSVYQRLAGF